MNCARNEKLLALHAGGDLPAGQLRALSAHLRTCDACRRTASDFATGRELLGLHEPPEFDAAFFDHIRRNVLREIDDAPPPTTLARLTAILFGRRALAFAACVAFLVAAGALVPYFREGRRGPSGDALPQLADSSGGARQEPGTAPVINTPVVSSAKVEPSPAPEVGPASSPQRRRQFVAGATHAPREKRSSRVAEPPSRVIDSAVAAETARAVNTTSPDEEAAALPEVAVLEEPAERRMLRIELQTGDPNVRIIWLAPQEPEKLPR